MRVIVVRHHAEDSAGFIGEAFEARGAELSVHFFPDDGPLPPFEGADPVGPRPVRTESSRRAPHGAMPSRSSSN